jgi:hypothetical protein
VDSVPENLVAPGIEPGTSGTVARNSDRGGPRHITQIETVRDGMSYG